MKQGFIFYNHTEQGEQIFKTRKNNHSMNNKTIAYSELNMKPFFNFQTIKYRKLSIK